MTSAIERASEIVAAVARADHPAPESGGPCATCAFRPGTEANKSELTYTLVKLCVAGGRTFHCHEKTQLCRGYIAAVNIHGPGFDEVVGRMADDLNDAIAAMKGSPR